MAYDFSRLTERQQELLTYGGWSVGCGFPARQPQARTVKKLLDRGLVVEHLVSHGPFTVAEYEVPAAVHVAWCAHCAKEGSNA